MMDYKSQVLLLIFVVFTPLLAIGQIKVVYEFAKNEGEYPPFQYSDSNNNIIGFNSDLIEEIFKSLDESVIQQKDSAPWKRQIENIKSGQLDILMDASKTTERAKFSNFSIPYRKEFIILIVRKNESSKFKINKIEDIISSDLKKLGVQQGYYYGNEFKLLLKNKIFKQKLTVVRNSRQLHEMLIKKRIDGYFYGRENFQLKSQSDSSHFKKTEQHPLPQIATGEIFFMFSKKTIPTKFIQKFNHSLQKLLLDGKVDRILRKHLERFKNQNAH